MKSWQLQSRSGLTWLSVGAAVAATVAASSKQFVPFFQFGSTRIFAAAAIVAAILTIPLWMLHSERFAKARGAAAILAGIWICATLSYLLFARQYVPPTYLLGFFLFSGFFLLIGISASFSLRSIAWISITVAFVYLCYLARYVAEMGFLYAPKVMVDSFGFPNGFGDIFGLSSDPAANAIDLYSSQYQNVGRFFSLSAISLLFLAGDRPRWRWLAWLLTAATFAMLFWIGARTSLVGLAAAVATTIVRSRQVPMKWILAMIVAGALLGLGFLVMAKTLGPVGIPAIDRTSDELQHSYSRTRGPILKHLVGVIEQAPGSALLGRGLGMFPVELGEAAPDWLIGRGISFYPHNVLLEALYEAGIAAIVLLAMLLYLPIGRAIAIWRNFTREETFALELYLFHLVSFVISGALAYSYDFYFILGLTIGTLRWRSAGNRQPTEIAA